MALEDGSATTDTYRYSPYGITTAAGTTPNDFRYTGREYEAEDLYYYRARYYDPTVGRFLAEDPLGLRSGDVNLYLYASGSPTTTVDSIGLRGQLIPLVRPPQPPPRAPHSREFHDALQNLPDLRTLPCGGLLIPCVPRFRCTQWQCILPEPPPPPPLPLGCSAGEPKGKRPRTFPIPGTPVMTKPRWSPATDPLCACVKWEAR
ncbi:MAG TPA: RHS repeat-associated core domain-containing protein [Oceanithermus profundus]|uniref:RHS repeat-associated core domain-containing protein n=1 Tax=Oceanithermus profundus TaxID=187137 RepID=A0A7C4ZGQ9_9DEIN|nr:RHS repeat-associated core domain-containing protein [Oceanithermus profundus]